MAEKILLDTDIGNDIDDAIALTYLLCQEHCQLLGITTVTGESNRRAAMASAICRHLGRDDIPIHPGCEIPLFGPPRQTSAPQAEMLSEWSCRTDFALNSGVEFLRRTIRENPNEVTLLAIGPLTNVATLFVIDPEIPSLLKRLVLMGGNFFTRMMGEWNTICDPHATAIVFGAGHQSKPREHVSFGLDVTTRCTLDKAACLDRFSCHALRPTRDFAEVFFRRHHQRIVFHDPLAAAGIFQPALCNYLEGQVTVSLDPATAGWTVFRELFENAPHTVAHEVHAEAFMDHFFQTVGA